MNPNKLIPHKSTLRFALVGMLGVTAFVTGLTSSGFSPVLNLTSALAEPVTLVAPQVPGFADVVEAVSPAVVSVRVEAKFAQVNRQSKRPEFRFDRRFQDQERGFPFFRDHQRDGKESTRPFRRDRRDSGPRRFGMSQGSGFFVSEDGYIVTNNHVIAGGSKITVILNDGVELEATLVGSDRRSDLAVLKVQSDQKFTYVAFDDKNPRIGEWVVAVGNPFGLGGTVTAGIVSANGREISASRYDSFLQIDAAVNKGNSGGPSFNLSGKVIGVNTVIMTPSGGNVGIAFAIPASTASQIVADLIDDGQVLRGWLGVQIQPVSKEFAKSVGLQKTRGAIVADTVGDSPASAAGIRPGDVITAVNGQNIKGPRALTKIIGNISPQSDTTITLWREGASIEVSLKLGKLNEANSSLQPGSQRPLKGLARMGLELRPSEDGNGVEVIDVVPGSSADKRGLRTGDIILTINGKAVNDPGQVMQIIRQARQAGGSAPLLQIDRGGNKTIIAVPLGRG